MACHLGRTVIFALLFFACSSGPSKSTPMEPTEPLVPTVQQPVIEQDFTGLFRQGEPGFPAGLEDMSLGESEASVRARQEAVHDAPKPVADYGFKGRLILGGALKGFERVRHTFILSEGVLDEFDLALPAPAAPSVMEQAWGPADETGVNATGRPQAIWRAAEMEVVVTEVEEIAIVKFRRLTPPQSP